MLTSLLIVSLTSFVLNPEIDESWQAAEEWADEHPVSFLRVELETDGGPLPFIYTGPSHLIRDYCKHDQEIVNGSESIPVRLLPTAFGGIAGPARCEISFEAYDSVIRAFGSGDCTRPSLLPQHFLGRGTWSKVRGEEVYEVPLVAKSIRSPDDRFDPIAGAGEPANFAGRWSVDFESSDELAIGTFTVDADQIASGTFLTTTGDYRFLAGRVDGDLMRLSTFDGAHAFLFHAEMQDVGTIKGDFWSGNWHHETWTAVRDDDATLPDAFEQTTITDERALADAVFKDIDGTPTRVLDTLDATNAKARVIEIFGTWCPNCADASRELVSLKEKYGDDLGIVGLAFEVTEDFERSSQQVQRHHAHIGSDWEILIAGLSDKAKATETLGFLDKVRSYPTLIFLNERNEVQAVYSGFSGPATGDAYTHQRERFEELIERMINE
tara:strand:- start:24349 stop:25665 length:1317 start_codon:yes stop_codon:yes gene_type:complete